MIRSLFAPARIAAVLGILAVLGFLALVARFHHPVYGFTVFYQLDATHDDVKIRAFRELPVYVHHDTGAYDGLYYAQLAHDPTLRRPELRPAMDDFPYRARRILAPALAWLFGAGQPRWIIHTYAWLNVITWLALAALLWRILAVRDVRGWFAWAGVLFSAGALSNVRLALTDNLALLLIAAALFASERWHGRVAVGLLASAALARETALLAVAGLCKSPWLSAKNFARIALVALPLAAWLTYVRLQVGAGDPGWDNFTLPAAGLLGKFREAWGALENVPDKPLAVATLLATVAIVTQAAYVAAKPQPSERWWRLGAAQAALMLFLGTAVWAGLPGAATRVLLPLQLAFNVLAHRRRAALAWLVAGNLSIGSGLLTLRDLPRPPDELQARELGDTLAIVRIGEGWYGREEDRRHVWLWTAQRGTLTLETIPAAVQPLRLEFALRSLTPRTVTLQVGNRELWRGEVGPRLSHHHVTLARGLPRNTRLEFATATLPTPENSAAGARPLAFALYDLRLALAEP